MKSNLCLIHPIGQSYRTRYSSMLLEAKEDGMEKMSFDNFWTVCIWN